MTVATFNGNPTSTIISSYNLTNVSDEADLIAFYTELSSLVCSMPQQLSHYRWRQECTNKLNKKVNNKFNLHNSSNRNE